MRVALLSQSDSVGGAARAAYRVHRALISGGIESLLLVNRKDSDDPTVVGPRERWRKGWNLVRPSVGRIPIYLGGRDPRVPMSPAWLGSQWTKYLKRNSADIIHLHWVNNEMLSIEDIGRLGPRVVWTLHDMWAMCGAEHLGLNDRWREGYSGSNRPRTERGLDVNRWVWERKRRAWRRPMQLVVPSFWMAECVKESYLFREWPVDVVPNALDTEEWKPIERLIARDLLGLAVNKRFIAFGAIGGLSDWNKGSDLLLDAIKELRGNLSDVEILIFGQGKPSEPLNFGFPVHYMGHLRDSLSLRVVYSAADIMIVPSRIESFGQTAAEAMACGTPVIGFRGTGLDDVILHRETGWLAKAYDASDISRGITWILADETRSRELGDRARNRVEKKFSYEAVLPLYREIYQKMLNKRAV